MRAKRTRNVISGTGTMTGLGQMGFSVTTVAEQAVPTMAMKLANKTIFKVEPLIFNATRTNCVISRRQNALDF